MINMGCIFAQWGKGQKAKQFPCENVSFLDQIINECTIALKFNTFYTDHNCIRKFISQNDMIHTLHKYLYNISIILDNQKAIHTSLIVQSTSLLSRSYLLEKFTKLNCPFGINGYL